MGLDLSASHPSLPATLTQVQELPLGWQAYASNTQPGQTAGQDYLTNAARRELALWGVEWLRAAGCRNPRPVDTVPPYLRWGGEWFRCDAGVTVSASAILYGQSVKGRYVESSSVCQVLKAGL